MVLRKGGHVHVLRQLKSCKPSLVEGNYFLMPFSVKVSLIVFVHFRRNINDKQNETYLKRCRYSSSKENRLCPIISLKTIFDEISDTAFENACVKVHIVLTHNPLFLHFNCQLFDF